MKATIPVVVAQLACFSSVSMAAPAAQSPAKPSSTKQSAPATGIDPAIVRQLKRVVARYQKLGDFTVSSLETIKTEGLIRRTKSTARIAANGRQAFKLEEVDAKGRSRGVKVVRLFDGLRFFESTEGRPETSIYLPQWQIGDNPVKTLFRGTYGMRFLPKLLARKSSPNLSAGLESESYRMHHLGGGKVQIECRVTGEAVDGSIIFGVLYLNLAADAAMERLSARVSVDGETQYEVRTIFSKPIPLRSKNAFTWSGFAPAPDPRGKFYISPQSRAAFERAARRYGGLRSYSVDFEQQSEIAGGDVPFDAEETGRLAWERRGRLRFENSGAEEIIVSDGTSVYESQFESYSKEPLEESTESGDVLDLIGSGSPHGGDLGGVTGYMVDFLHGSASLAEMEGFESFKTNLFPGHILDGILCDVVVIRAVPRGSDSKHPRETKVWFSRQDGRFLRLTIAATDGKGERQESDLRLKNERRNPFLSPLLWILTPPESEVEEARSVSPY